MWVKFPSVRNFDIANQSECLVEIFKNNAWETAGTNDGGYFTIVRRGNNYDTDTTKNNIISAGFIDKQVNGIAITDTEWHHIAVSVKLETTIKSVPVIKGNQILRYTPLEGKYEISLFIDDKKTSSMFTISDKDQIFMGSYAYFNIGKYTRGIRNCEECGYANMSVIIPELDKRGLYNRVLTDNEIKILASNKPA